MKRHTFPSALLSLLLLIGSCVGEELPSDDTPSGNLEALWQLLDERYCFFDYKKEELGLDWDEVHEKYRRQVNDKMSSVQLFEVCCNMIGELRDGHVNLGAAFDLGRNWSFWEDHAENYYDSIARGYLGTDYCIASALKYKVLDDNIGYVRCESFSDGLGEGNISSMMTLLAPCNGLIVDVRGNGGGKMTNARTLASFFINGKTLVGYSYHKTGKGHGDFSEPEAEYLDPSVGMRWQKPVVVITNRKCFSATNEFVKMMKCSPNVTLLGDTTGGGSGLPFTQEVPCGWSVRYSAVVYVDRDKQHTEFGIAPDIRVDMDMADAARRRDTLIERAREYLNGKDK